jgi:two-component system sensor histidine kinase YesM
MEETEINSISDENLAKNQSSFGLRGTIQRLKIHYGTDNIYKVESKKYVGTNITLKIPIEGEHS